MRTAWPALMAGEPPPIRNADDLNAAALAGYALYASGDLERGNRLLDLALRYMGTVHRIRGEGYSELDVTIHVLRGDKASAVSALGDAVLSGWRDNWWRLRYPFYDVMLDEPRWVEWIRELEADAQRQRQWFERHKNDPLF